MADEERLNKIRAVAAAHSGRYLLPHRYIHGLRPESENDLDYDACKELVRRGEAAWINPFTGPGIQIVRGPVPPPEPTPPMPLDEALRWLAEIHTRDDSMAGWVLTIGARPAHLADADYLRAWEAVRRHLHLQVDPPEEKA